MTTNIFSKSVDSRMHFSNKGIYWAIAIVIFAAVAITYFLTARP